jgi:UDP-glucuronate 4-epimerase
MNILITGCLGFIGYHLFHKLLDKEYKVTGIDNLNNYYSVKLKKLRLNNLKKKFFRYKKVKKVHR